MSPEHLCAPSQHKIRQRSSAFFRRRVVYDEEHHTPALPVLLATEKPQATTQGFVFHAAPFAS